MAATRSIHEGPLVLGIDAGTSVVKSVVFDLTGQEVAMARARVPFQTPHAFWAELDMEALWRAAAETIRQLTSDGRIASRIVAVGVTGTASGAWLTDAHDRPVRPAILWNDGRAAEIVRAWQETGVLDEVFRISGNVIYPGFGAAALRWLLDNEPETLRRAARYFFSKDWVRYHLTGDFHTDDTDISFFPCDLAGRRYSPRIFELCGISALRHLLPPVVASTQVTGTITSDASAQTGLPQGIPVVAGLNDVTAAALGAGAVRPGQACSILGTSNLNNIVLDKPLFVPHGVGSAQCTVDGCWLRSYVNTSGTLNVDWAVDVFFPEAMRSSMPRGTTVYALMEAEAARAPLGSGALIYHPYLNSAGVVSPFVHPAARATLFGLSVGHSRAHVLRAVYEGVALAIHDCYSGMGLPFQEVVLSGGGARSRLWGQIIADVTGKPMVVPQGEEFGARGAAMAAAIGVGVFRDARTAAAEMVRPGRRHEPDQANHARYEEIYALYKQLYSELPEVWWARHRLALSLERSGATERRADQ